MQQKIEAKLKELINELELLSNERKGISLRLEEIDVRTHQLVGAIYELKHLLSIDP